MSLKQRWTVHLEHPTSPLHVTSLYCCPTGLQSNIFNMDDDIQDILASVTAPTIPQRKLDLQALTRAWVNERTSPSLLPYPSDVIERVMDRIKKQVRIAGYVC